MISKLLITCCAAIGVISGLSCKSKNRSTLSDFSPTTFREAIFLNNHLLSSQPKCQQNLFNAYAESLANGWLINTAYSGLQTKSPVGVSLKTDSLYYQSLRVFSIIDWDLTARIQARSPAECLPDHFSMLWSPLPMDGQTRFADAFPNEAPRLRKVSDLLGLPAAQLSILVDQGGGAVETSTSYGIKLKQAYLEDSINQNQDPSRKLLALIQSYNPLYARTFFDLTGDQHLGFQLLLPRLGELEIKNIDSVSTWNYTPGIKRRSLLRQVDVNVARLLDISYLEDGGARDTPPAIGIRIHKELKKNPHVLTTTISFGKFIGFKPDGQFNIDISQNQDAFVIGLIPKLTINQDDSSVIKNIKEELNKATAKMKIDARIHQLTLQLERDPKMNPRDHGPDAVTFQPRFKLRESALSFRVYQTITATSELALLQAVGFNCPKKSVGSICFQDFGAFSELNNYLTDEKKGPLSGRWKTAVGDALKKALNIMMKYNAKFLINWNIQAIESALDQQFAQIFADLLDQQMETREKVRETIERVLFEESND